MIRVALIFVVFAAMAVSTYGDEFVTFKRVCADDDPRCFQPVEGIGLAEALVEPDPHQKKPENKFWKNLLGTYNMARQMASATLEIVNSALNVANSVQKQITAAERFFLQIEDIARNCSLVVAKVEDVANNWDWRDPAKMVIRIEEEIMQVTDDIVLGSLVGLPAAYRENIKAARGLRDSMNVGKVFMNNVRAVDSSARTISWFAWMMADVREKEGEARRDTIEARQAKILNDGKTDPALYATENRFIRRTEYFQALAEHEIIGENITLWAEMLLRETEYLGVSNVQRQLIHEHITRR